MYVIVQELLISSIFRFTTKIYVLLCFLHTVCPQPTGFLRSRREKRKEKKAKKKKDIVETSSNKEEKSDLSVYAHSADLVHQRVNPMIEHLSLKLTSSIIEMN